MKRIISLLLSMIIMFSITADTFAAYGGELARAYEADDCTVTYTIQNEWDGNQQISMSVTNNGSDTMRNWALKFDCADEITNIWNATVVQNTDGLCVIKNNGYNYEIIPNSTVEFGFQLRGDELALPESVAVCNKTVDSTESAEVSYEIRDNWGDGFIAEVSVTNNSDVPFEAWRLAFSGNFEISNIWNVNKLYTENDFLVENNVATVPIASGETKSFGFQGVIASGETPELSDFALTSVVIDLDSENPVDPDKPVNPDKPVLSDALTLLCFGEYSEATNILEIYWKSNFNAPVSIYENNDGIGWNKIAEVADDTAYNHEINENFLIKQIKVSQETENGVIESAPFIVASTENGVVCTWLDSDNDGIPDYMETIFGTDPQNPDTDNDGLSDYDEIYKTVTNPLKYDTDENGISDADDDKDSDGLSNKAELEFGTNPSNPDTDKDGLSDYDEINKYDTDPLNADSDNDTLNDSDEIAIGLDPNNPETFGVPDAEYKLEQTISADSEALSDINTDEAPYELSLDIRATGNAKTQLIAKTSNYSKVTDSSARLGDAVDLSYISGNIDSVKLTYKISEEYLSDNNGENPRNALDLQGVKRYNIFRFFDEINMLLPVETEYDEECGTVFAETDELGTYCVLDMEMLLRNMDALPDNSNFEIVSRQMYSAAGELSDETEQIESDDFTSITFIIDIRDISFNYSALNDVKNEIDAFALRAFKHERNCEIRLVIQNSTDFDEPCFTIVDKVSDNGAYTDYEAFHNALTTVINYKDTSDEDIFGGYCIISEALDEVLTNADPNVRNYIFDIFAQDKAIYEQSTAARINENAKNNKVHVSFVTKYGGEFEGLPAELVSATNGIVINDFYSFGNAAYDFVWSDEDQIKNEDYYAITATGYNEIKLDSKLYPNGYWNGLHLDADTDQDGITDWDEVITRLLKETDNGYELPTVSECKDALGTVPFYVQNAFNSESEAIELYGSYPVLPLRSDPTSIDGDKDGLSDWFENVLGTNPLNKDTDNDGKEDKDEINIGLDPLYWDTDHDGISDGEDKNPYTYDKSWEEHFVDWAGYLCYFSEGLICGDFVRVPNLPQLVGIVVANFIPGYNVAIDIRDLIANIAYGDWLFTGLTALALLPTIGDISKAVSKVLDFIFTGAKNADEAAAAMKVMNNVLPPVYDGVKHSDEFVDGVKRFSCLDVAKMLPDPDDASIRRVLNISAKSGDVNSSEIIKAFRDVEGNDSLKLFRIYVEGTELTSFAEYQKSYENILKNVSGFGDELSQFVKRSVSPQQAAIVMEACSKYGDTVLKAINKCGDEYAELIARCVSHKKFANGVATQFLNAMTDHSDSMIKAIKACGIENYDTIADYSKIFGKFGDNANNIIDKCLAKKFVGLDKALNSGADAIGFAPLKNDPGSYRVVVNGVYHNNPTIYVPKGLADRLKGIDELPEMTKNEKKAKRMAYMTFYNNLLTDEYVTTHIKDADIAAEYRKLIEAIQDARNHFKNTGGTNCSSFTGIIDDYSFFNNRSVINCSEIWAARAEILSGGKFEDISLSTYHLKSDIDGRFLAGSVFEPCENCQKTFEKILKNNGG